MENLSMETIMGYVETYGIPVLKAIAIYIIGSWIIKKLMRVIKTVMSKKSYDESLQKFLVNLVGWALKIFLIITVVGTLGVETTSFAALIAAAGLAIGMALQGSLANFAGGVLLMIFKPYKIGDLVEAQEFGQMVSFKNNKLKSVSLKRATSKYNFVEPDHYLIHTARSLGISFGD